MSAATRGSVKAAQGFRGEVEREYPDYLRDESRRIGRAAGIAFPETEDEVRRLLAAAGERGLPVTLQGARTGITGGAAPEGGLIVNLSRMNRLLGLRHEPGTAAFELRVQPGVLLSEIRRAVADKAWETRPPETPGAAAEQDEALRAFRAAGPYFFPPDPTETSASIGGMAACNASGALSFFYGPTRRYIERLRVILADGSALDLRRGTHRAEGRAFSVRTDSGRTIAGSLPAYALPAVKNAAGYFARDDMDLVDLFIGSEGTLGIVSELSLRLAPAPAACWGMTAFFPSERAAVDFVQRARTLESRPAAMEFFDSGALNLLRRRREEQAAAGDIPDMPAAWHTAVYVEYHGDSEAAVEAAVLAASGVMTACGGSEDATWLASDSREMEKLKAFRHAVPESVNLLIDQRRQVEPALTKLGTDLAVPDSALVEMFARYHGDLDREGLEYVIFGHIGDNHLHVNIIPKTMEEYRRGKALYADWARVVVARGGSVSAEHGIGKLKTGLLAAMYGEPGIRDMRAVKALFDPEGRLNPGNLFEAGEGQP